MYDAHCHPVEGEVGDCSQDIEMILMTSRKEEWAKVLNFKRHSKAFGIHPWFAHLHDWEQDGQVLEQFLKDNPSALVGEIGLDRAAKDLQTGKHYPFDTQVNFCN